MEKKSRFLAIRATPDMYRQIRERAERDDITMTAVMEQAVAMFMEAEHEPEMALAA
jgi:predicted transcriptional regulator